MSASLQSLSLRLASFSTRAELPARETGLRMGGVICAYTDGNASSSACGKPEFKSDNLVNGITGPAELSARSSFVISANDQPQMETFPASRGCPHVGAFTINRTGVKR